MTKQWEFSLFITEVFPLIFVTQSWVVFFSNEQFIVSFYVFFISLIKDAFFINGILIEIFCNYLFFYVYITFVDFNNDNAPSRNIFYLLLSYNIQIYFYYGDFNIFCLPLFNLTLSFEKILSLFILYHVFCFDASTNLKFN